jgi:two-component system nitrogen regulation response regulator GlnG
MDGLEAIERFQALCGNVPVIIITAFGNLPTAVEAVRRGAFDYIAKPFDVGKVKNALARALASQPGQSPVLPPIQVEGMVGRSPAMQEVYKQIALAAASDVSVLLYGESGTGKELAARAIHRYSPRAAGPFVAVNVASLSDTLAESELFGHVRGAFTGAELNRVGLLAQANGGTLFLDEVADIPQATQVKLLRALEHGEVTPVGASKPVQTDLRVISATHSDLVRCAEEGNFRHDLYFRISGFQIDLPPLRQRREDIVELAQYFTAALAKPPGTQNVLISTEALAELKRRPWHGNVRELRNTIDHALILARGHALLPEHLPPPVVVGRQKQEDGGAEVALIAAVRRWADQNIEKQEYAGRLHGRLLELIEGPLFEAATARHHGQCATAARQLGIHRTTLRKKLSEYGLDSDTSAMP